MLSWQTCRDAMLAWRTGPEFPFSYLNRLGAGLERFLFWWRVLELSFYLQWAEYVKYSEFQ